MRTHNNSSGFTLIEMMIVVSIILIISSGMVWSYSSQMKHQRVLTTALKIKALMELARSEALKQQYYPLSLTRGLSPSVGNNYPRYWPFVLQYYDWEEDGSPRSGLSVGVAECNSVEVFPSLSDENPEQRGSDITTMVVLPKGVVITNVSGNRTNFSPADRPVFWSGGEALTGGDFVTGSLVGIDNGIIITDEVDDSYKVFLKIDPKYGTVMMEELDESQDI